MGQNVDPSGQLDMQQLLAAAQQMQSQLMNAQQELADAEVEGTAGGGLVKVVVNGQGELVDITISAGGDRSGRPGGIGADHCRPGPRRGPGRLRAASDLQQEKMGPFAAGIGGSGEMSLPGIPRAARGQRAAGRPARPVKRDSPLGGGP